jgi:hypothetical protein
MISHIDLFIGLVAVLTLVRAARRPHPVHPTTAILLTLLTGVLLWANLRNSGWQEVWNERAPEGLGPVTKAMFYRGWPFAPFMACIIYFNRFRPAGGEGLALVFDWLVLFAALYVTKAACERLLQRRCHGNL